MKKSVLGIDMAVLEQLSSERVEIEVAAEFQNRLTDSQAERLLEWIPDTDGDRCVVCGGWLPGTRVWVSKQESVFSFDCFDAYEWTEIIQCVHCHSYQWFRDGNC